MADVVYELREYRIEVDIADPLADKNEIFDEYGLHLKETIDQKYDATVVAVAHEAYKNLSIGRF